MWRDVLRTHSRNTDPLVLPLESLEPRFEAADPKVKLLRIVPHEANPSFDRDGTPLRNRRSSRMWHGELRRPRANDSDSRMSRPSR